MRKKSAFVALAGAFLVQATILCFIVAAASPARAHAESALDEGDLDSSFGQNGFVVTAVPGAIRRLTLQGDKLLAWVADDDFTPPNRLIRFNADGSLDQQFGVNGILRPSLFLRVVYPSLRGMVLAGSTPGSVYPADPGKLGEMIATPAIARYTYNGQPDLTFGSNGVITRELWYSNTLAPGGVMAVREEQNGRLVAIGGATIQADPGSIYSTEGLFIAHFNPDGSPVNNFGPGGYVVRPDSSLNLITYALAFQRGGNFVRLGFTGNQYWARYFIARYSPLGLPLTPIILGFGAQSVSYACTSPGDMIADPDSRILYTYHNYCQGGYPSVDEVVLNRRNSDLSADPTFTQFSALPSNTNAGPIVQQSDGKIILVRSPQSAIGLLRLNADSSPDASFGLSGTVTTTVTPYFPDPAAVDAKGHAVVVQLDGKIIVGGSYISPNGGNRYLLLARYNGTPVDIRNTYLPLAPH